LQLLLLVLFYYSLFLREKNPLPQTRKGVNPVPFIQTCARQAVYENLEKIMAQGGFINPTKLQVI